MKTKRTTPEGGRTALVTLQDVRYARAVSV